MEVRRFSRFPWMTAKRKKWLVIVALIVLGVFVFFLFDDDSDDDPQWDAKPGKGINEPYGGKLQVLLVDESQREAMKKEAVELPSYQLTDRQLCDTELLLNGGFSPLRGFMNEETYKSVVSGMKLPGPSGLIWPMPITLDVNEKDSKPFVPGKKIALRDSYFNLIAIMTVEDVYKPDANKECLEVFGTNDLSHPGCDYVQNTHRKAGGAFYIGGELKGFQLPLHYDFKDLRRSPTQLRQLMEQKKWSNIVAFQTRNPMHKAHIEITRRAAENVGGNVLIHPVVGMTKPGDIDYITRVKCYQAIVAPGKPYYPEKHVLLSLLPLAMRMGGPREALWHAIIRKNYGATHFIIGRDHAGTKDENGKSFYGPYDAQKLVQKHANDIGIGVETYSKMVYDPSRATYVPQEELEEEASGKDISGTQFRALLASGDEIPEWFADPDAVAILREEYPSNLKRGFTLFFTGLSGSGKTTVAHALIPILRQHARRKITLLDGDRVRTYLSKGLTFSREDRDANVHRLGYVASEISKHGGVAIVSAIAPYRSARQTAREIVEAEGGAFFEVWQSTPLEKCQERDPKGLYKKVAEGIIKNFTGVDDPYEEPLNADIEVDGSKLSVDQGVEKILKFLREKGYLPLTAHL